MDRPQASAGDFDREALDRALSELPEELRLPVVLHYREGLKYREIAEALECPQGTVATRVANAK